MPSRAPTPCTITESGLPEVTRGSFCRSDPAAAFRGFAKRGFPNSSKLSLSSVKALSGKKTSPRISISAGGFSLCSTCGKFFIVLTLRVTSSPVTPLPRVSPLTNTPFLYVKLIARPSTLSSHKYCGCWISLSTRSNHEVNSSISKTLSKLIIFSM